MAWPFWAPTRHERIEHALDIAGLSAGERLLDLGCGDGRVLLAAANRGARVIGVEVDADLAGQARRLLALADVAGDVVEADFTSVDLEADVVFAYLSPATLQRLTPQLEQLAPGSRVVTTGFGVPGWEPERVDDRCFLYRVPATRTAVSASVGWASSGVLVGLRAGASTLISVNLHHPGGPVAVRADEALANALELMAGTDVLSGPADVVIDLRWRALEAGTVVAGALTCEGVGALKVFGIATDGATGVWGLADERACEHVERALADPARSAETLLEQARRTESS
jgi:SAM-dependent methyltransferase